jgi:hypothetical protein
MKLKSKYYTGGRKPTHLTPATSVKTVNVVPDVRNENTDVRWVGYHPVVFYCKMLLDVKKID